jgi:peptidoglycan/LPS O-acetylase OafA/YrhL
VASPVRYQSLDLWRGVACLMIVVFHATSWGVSRLGGPPESVAEWTLVVTSKFYVGVTLFFVISGYCITASALRPSSARGVADFVMRRLRRIFPPYWVALGLTVVVALTLQAFGAADLVTTPIADNPMSAIPLPGWLNGWQWVGNLALVESWRTRFVWRGGPLLIHAPSWTLAFEEQFYLLSALLLVVSRAHARRYFAGALALTVLVVAVMSTVSRSHLDGLFLDGRWLQFAAGVAVYFAIHHTGAAGRWFVVSALLLPLAWWPGGAGRGSTALAGLFALVLIAAYRWDRRSFDARLAPLRWCGHACYSLYLVHWPISKVLSLWIYRRGIVSPSATLLVTVPAVLTASLSAAWVFERFVERRFRNPPQIDRVPAGNGPGR